MELDNVTLPEPSLDIEHVFSPNFTSAISETLREALSTQAAGAAKDFAAKMQAHIQLVFLMTNDEAVIEDVVLMGAEAGTLFIKSDIELDSRQEPLIRGRFSLVSAFSRGGVSVVADSGPWALVDGNFAQEFFVALWREFSKYDHVAVSKTVPASADLQGPSFALPLSAINYRAAFKAKILVGVLAIVIAACVLFAGISAVRHWPWRGHAASLAHVSSVGQASVSPVGGGMPASSSSGINGITIPVGGQGEGSTSDLGAMGIKVGKEVGNDLSNQSH